MDIKKYFISLLLLSGMTVAWAGTGFGTFTDPYSGEWDSSTLGAKLMAGDYLKYDCKIVKSQGIYVTDIKLGSQIVQRWAEWAVADAIDDTPWSDYGDYERYNPKKQNQLFIVAEVKYIDSELYIKGCYTGHYDRGDGSKDNPYWGEWKVADLAPRLKPGDYLAYDCEVVGSVNVNDVKLNRSSYMDGTSWPVGKCIDINGLHVYNDYINTWNSEEDRKHQMFIVSNVNIIGEKSVTISGHYTGTYPNMQDADGYYQVGSFYGLKKAIEQGGSNAKIKLTNDIYIPSSGDNTLSSGTFSGEISGLCYVPDMMTGATKAGTFGIHGTSSPTQRECNGAFFDALKGAKIENLTFTNMSIPKKSGENWGLICRTAENTEFRNIILQFVDVFGDDDNVGLLAGKATKCTFDVVSIFHSTVKAYGQNAGCMAGKSEGSSFENCMTDMASGVWADGTYPNAFVGGMVGYSEKDNFHSCLNSASVGGLDDEVGGYVGYSYYSLFTLCSNAGQVVHCDEDEFNSMIKKIRETLHRMTAADIDKYSTAVELVAGVPGLFLGLITGTFATFGTAVVLGFISCAIIETCGMAIVVIAAVAAFLATYYFVTWAFDQFTLDDELGGIVGRAEGGTFESCWNSGHLVCKQSYGGGIVGIGKGVTIRNCMNSDVSEFDKNNCGSIIGQACSYDGHKTMVTSCFSEADYPIVGDPNGEMDDNSSYNYRHYKGKSDRRNTNEYEVEVSDKIVKSGILTHWLNNSAVNRAAGVSPWRQNLETMKVLDEGIQVDDFPTIDDTHHEVTSEYIPLDYKISNAADLKAFAEAVNSSTEGNNANQFLRAALVDDIDMTDELWTPIGKNESYKQFRGYFDGRGHTIKGLKCTSGNGPVGLFGAVHVNAEIMNVNLDDACEFTCNGDAGAGGIVGLVKINWKWGSVVIENCSSCADIKVNKHGGGILGRVDAGGYSTVKVYINKCYSMGDVTAENGNSALLCGYAQNSSNVSNCWSTGKLLSSKDGVKPYDAAHSEFFVGYLDQANISGCYAIDPDVSVQYATSGLNQNGVTNLTETAVASGELAYRFNQSCDEPVLQQIIGVDPLPTRGSDGVYHVRTISADAKGYGTVCLPFALESNDEITYYSFEEGKTEDGETILTFNKRDKVNAGLPALFRTSKVGELTFHGVGDEWNNKPWNGINMYTDWGIVGTYGQQVFTESTTPSSIRVYYLSRGEIHNAKTATILPFRAWFGGPSIYDLTSNGAKAARVRLVIDGVEDETLALELVAGDLMPEQSVKAYTLFGTEAGSDYRGLMIRGGKKVMVSE